MNKRIFSLVCIVLYSLLVAPTHCSEQKESGLRNRIIRAIKKIKRSNKKNEITIRTRPNTFHFVVVYVVNLKMIRGYTLMY
ncbi:fam-c protein [Plasmodium yoelii yoelii]|uniref:Fam-c protein n=1 Tax=Plasmodium yoelii yoelii TaxID=73239 RepID=A0AAF0B2V1_PLAYO|nr:fam-c protein [Plasmodium yoelii yoelii]